MYYETNTTTSHNKLMNFVIGTRGCGKTYGWKVRVIKDFLEKGEQAIWLRRYDNELHGFQDTFVADVVHLFPETEFLYKDHKLYINGKVAIFFQALSIAYKKKSASYPNVTRVLYDEFLIETKGVRYLTNEPEQLLSFLDTVIRNRENFRHFIGLANSTSMINPFFMYFGLVRKADKKGCIKKDDMLVQIVKNENFVDMRKKTRFGKLIQSTDYGSYSLDNEFLFDNTTFISNVDLKNAVYLFTFVCEINLGVWYADGGIHISEKNDPNFKEQYTTQEDKLKPNIRLLKSSTTPFFKSLIKLLNNSELTFSSVKAKNVFLNNIYK